MLIFLEKKYENVLTQMKTTSTTYSEELISPEIEEQLRKIDTNENEIINAGTWTDYVESLRKDSLSQFYGEELAAGYLAKKLKHKFPEYALDEEELRRTLDIGAAGYAPPPPEKLTIGGPPPPVQKI